jgi:hypothetical protein
MNEKAARMARQINRASGLLAKRGPEAKLPHKLPRKVKRHWATLSHRMARSRDPPLGALAAPPELRDERTGTPAPAGAS